MAKEHSLVDRSLCLEQSTSFDGQLPVVVEITKETDNSQQSQQSTNLSDWPHQHCDLNSINVFNQVTSEPGIKYYLLLIDQIFIFFFQIMF